MKNNEEQQLLNQEIGEPCAGAPQQEQNGYTYMTESGCEITVCFAKTESKGLVQKVLGMLLQDACRKE